MTLDISHASDLKRPYSDVWLADQSILVPDIHRLEQRDEEKICRVLFGLDADARCTRFGYAAENAYLVNYARRALVDAAWIAGAFADDRLRGIVEIYDGLPGGRAEAIFVVEQEWRRRGLGWALLKAAMQIAADAGIPMLRMLISRHNWPMRRLAAKAGGQLDMMFDEIIVDVTLGSIVRNAGLGTTVD
jgi:GNAT superfamily N-acetyltransferase